MGGHDTVRKLDRQGDLLIWCRKMHGLCEAKDGTQVDELLQAGESGHKRIRQDAKNESRFLKMAGSLPRRQETGRLKGQKRKITRKEYRRLSSEFEMGGFMAQNCLPNLAA